MRVVLDTNVIVAALLRPHGPPAQILRLVLRGELEIAVNEAILLEYEEVLHRPKFRLPRGPVELILKVIDDDGFPAPPFPGPLTLPDPDDLPFLEAALASGADALVTGNSKHFPSACCHGLRVMTPSEFLNLWASGHKS